MDQLFLIDTGTNPNSGHPSRLFNDINFLFIFKYLFICLISSLKKSQIQQMKGQKYLFGHFRSLFFIF